MKFEAWHYGYVYYLYPNLETKTGIDYEKAAELMRKLRDNDKYETAEAKAFQAGYASGLRMVEDKLGILLREINEITS